MGIPHFRAFIHFVDNFSGCKISLTVLLASVYLYLDIHICIYRVLRIFLIYLRQNSVSTRCCWCWLHNVIYRHIAYGILQSVIAFWPMFVCVCVCVCITYIISVLCCYLQEYAVNGDHLWIDTNASGDLCYVGETECSVSICVIILHARARVCVCLFACACLCIYQYFVSLRCKPMNMAL